jgi:lipoyl(octanoyl) transferase
VNLDLAPFRRINPCGYAGLEMTQLAELTPLKAVSAAAAALQPHLIERLGFGPAVTTL